jgi:flagellar basal body P-ring formation protein FlgA
LVFLAGVTMPAHGARQLPAPLSGDARPVIEQFLANQTSGLPGKVVISIDTPLSGALPPCETLEPFLPGRARLWGRISVGVRCMSGQPWTRYVPAYIAVTGSYHVAARAISAGQALAPADIALREGDLTTLPASVVIDPVQLIGMTASNAIASGAPIRRELLRGAMLVQQGQNIKVVSRGAGFVVSAEGKAMTDAALGAVVQVKMQGGQLLSGIVRPNGVVERSH